MIKVSNLVAAALAESLQASGVERNKGLRLTEEDGFLTLKVDSPRDNDRVICYQGYIVMIIDRILDNACGEAMIDADENEEGPFLVLRIRDQVL